MRLSSAVAALACLLATTPAFALEAPSAGKVDPRMLTITYKPGDIYYVHLVVGHTLAITLPKDEVHNETLGSDSKHLEVTALAGTPLIFLKPKAPMPAKSFFIYASMPDGSSRLYTIQLDVVDEGGADTDPYTLTFVDKQADAQAAATARRVWQAKAAEKFKLAQLTAAAAATSDTNYKYVLQGETAGDWNLLPTREVGDNGRDTHWHFPQVEAHPQIYVVSPDGKETVADCSPDTATNVTTCHQTAAQWRLRSGNSELCVFNKAFDPVGVPAPTNTSSPDYERTLRETTIR